MFSRVRTAATFGIAAYLVDVETQTEPHLPAFVIVGLPDNAVKESRERIMAALKHSGYDFPNRKVVANLAPADIRKEGSGFDLPLALGILGASEQFHSPVLEESLVVGELALDGTLRPVHGVLSIALEARKAGMRRLVTPFENAREAAMVQGLAVHPCRSLDDAVALLEQGWEHRAPFTVDLAEVFHRPQQESTLDFSDVRGQESVKRALEVAAAGGHNILLIGPPGSGKTMLAKRMPTILPPLAFEEALETTRIHSVAGLLSPGAALVTARPFRAPHHTISDAALVGGGIGMARPGEISLSHNGVLFLDELPEFARNVLEVLRQPLEEGMVTIARSRLTVEYPANFILVAAMNPCPCGQYGNPHQNCSCSPVAIQRYLAKISGPLLDRIDLHIECPFVRYQELAGDRVGEASTTVRDRVIAARERQHTRFAGRTGLYCNADMSHRDIRRVCRLDEGSQELMKTAMSRLGFSARAYDRMLKVARTIADLDGSADIRAPHVSEAIQYRSLDRQVWALNRQG